MKNTIIIILTILFYGCTNTPKTNNIVINWNYISNTEKPIDFCQVDSTNIGYIFSYSYSFAISGGCKIKTITNKESITKDSTLFGNANTTISYVLSKDSVFWIVQNDFEGNTLNTKLFQKFSNDSIWKKVNTPLERIRKITSLNNVIIIEGNLNGSGRVFKSIDNGKSWKEINVLNLGLKSLYLISADQDKILCQGSISFNDADSKLLLLDVEKHSIKTLLDLNDKKYLKPILKNQNLFAIIGDDKVNIYSIVNEKTQLIKEFNFPDESIDVLNLFMNDQYYIISAEQKKRFGKTLSWISHDRGENWIPFEQEGEYKLVYNDFGQLFMVDRQNNLLIRK